MQSTPEKRAARAAYMRVWCAKNREHVNARKRILRQQHLEHEREMDRTRYSRDPVLKLRAGKRWRDSHPDKVREMNVAYNEKHAEERRTYMREYIKRSDMKAKRKAWAAAKRKARPDVERGYRRRYLERLSLRRAGRPRPEVCDVCDKPGTGKYKNIHFDHDHQTGMFRGWLCHNCNVALGFANDDPEILLKLVEYLKRSRALREA